MAGQHEADASVAFQRLHQRDVLLAGDAVDDVHALVDQTFDEQVGHIAHVLAFGFVIGLVIGHVERSAARFAVWFVAGRVVNRCGGWLYASRLIVCFVAIGGVFLCHEATC